MSIIGGANFARARRRWDNGGTVSMMVVGGNSNTTFSGRGFLPALNLYLRRRGISMWAASTTPATWTDTGVQEKAGNLSGSLDNFGVLDLATGTTSILDYYAIPAASGNFFDADANVWLDPAVLCPETLRHHQALTRQGTSGAARMRAASGFYRVGVGVTRAGGGLSGDSSGRLIRFYSSATLTDNERCLTPRNALRVAAYYGSHNNGVAVTARPGIGNASGGVVQLSVTPPSTLPGTLSNPERMLLASGTVTANPARTGEHWAGWAVNFASAWTGAGTIYMGDLWVNATNMPGPRFDLAQVIVQGGTSALHFATAMARAGSNDWPALRQAMRVRYDAQVANGETPFMAIVSNDVFNFTNAASVGLEKVNPQAAYGGASAEAFADALGTMIGMAEREWAALGGRAENLIWIELADFVRAGTTLGTDDAQLVAYRTTGFNLLAERFPNTFVGVQSHLIVSGDRMRLGNGTEGWWAMGGTQQTITSTSASSGGLVTVTTGTAHGLSAGSETRIAGTSQTALNRSWRVFDAPTATTYRIESTVAATGSGGTSRAHDTNHGNVVGFNTGTVNGYDGYIPLVWNALFAQPSASTTTGVRNRSF